MGFAFYWATSTAYQLGLNATHQLLYQAYTPLFLDGLHASISTRLHAVISTRLYFYMAYMPLFIHGVHAASSTWLTCHYFYMATLLLFIHGILAPISTWPLFYNVYMAYSSTRRYFYTTHVLFLSTLHTDSINLGSYAASTDWISVEQCWVQKHHCSIHT